MEHFSFLPFEEMSPEDYQKVGFMGGLEVHQQLDTDKKLFCRCPSGQFSKDFHGEILRHMRPTLSELGEYDGTALMEFKTTKNITYHINRATTCTYEMDDTPPFEINEEALDKALAIGLFFKSSIVDELHIARKQYLDGSIPTGFQRTAIFCLNGHFPLKDRVIDIVQMSIEEDSCRELSDEHHDRHYNTDRLGMPLIETVTAPQARTPQEMAELCNLIRYAVRATGLVRTGPGASRQDVNVSIRGGTRIEIKGVPSIRTIPELCYNEAMRQWNLLKIKTELGKRGVTEVKYESADIGHVISETKAKPVRRVLNDKGRVMAVRLFGFDGLLAHPTQSNTTFSKEFADRVRVIACLSDQPNMDHSDEKNVLEPELWNAVIDHMGAGKRDAVILVWGNERDTSTAVDEIVIRAEDSLKGVPSETRQALDDATNGFERILPGSDRMYPDTDLPPKCIDSERLEAVGKWLPTKYWKSLKTLQAAGFSTHLCGRLSAGPYRSVAARLASEGISIHIIARALYDQRRRFCRKYSEAREPDQGKLGSMISYVVRNGLPEEAIFAMHEAMYRRDDHHQPDDLKPAKESEMDDAILSATERWAGKQIYHKEKREMLIAATAKNLLFGRAPYTVLLAMLNEMHAPNG